MKLLVEIGEEHADELGGLFERCEDYFTLVFGLPPGPAEVQSAFIALPEGKTSYEDKVLLGVMAPEGELIGHVDVVKDHPAVGEWTIGAFLLAPEARGRGLGRALFDGLSEWARSAGAAGRERPGSDPCRV